MPPSPALATAIACLLLVIGLVLLFFGNRLSQWGFMLGAVCTAGTLATACGRACGLPEWQLWLWSAVGAGIACLLASFLFRVWMGFTGMLFMAALVAAIVVIWQGPPLPAWHSPTPGQWAQAGGHAPGETFGRVWTDNEAALRLWWQRKPEAGRHVIRLALAIGGMLGLGLGLAVPLRAAALQCAVAGAGLCLVAARQLAELHAPAQATWLPETPRAILLTLLVLAALGFAAQGGGGEDGTKAPPKKDEKKTEK